SARRLFRKTLPRSTKSFWRASATARFHPAILNADLVNSPSLALIWEIWRKNRWGFALLIVMLAVCMVLSRIAVRFQHEAAHLESSLPEVAEATPGSAEIIARSVQMKLGSRVVYEGELLPGNV